jgi:hypothetical protein
LQANFRFPIADCVEHREVLRLTLVPFPPQNKRKNKEKTARRHADE